MSDALCEKTNEPVLGYKDARIIVYPNGCDETHFVDIDWLFEEIAKGKGEGMRKLQKFVDDRHCIFG